MPVIPAGPISPIIVAVRQLIAASPAFQTWTGHAGNSTEAAKSVHLFASLPFTDEGYEPQDVINTRPCAILNLAPQMGWLAERNSSDGFIPFGRIMAEIQDNVPEPEDGVEAQQHYYDVALSFMNSFGQVMEEVATIAESGAYPMFQRIYSNKPIARIDPDLRESQGDYHFGYIIFEWGFRA